MHVKQKEMESTIKQKDEEIHKLKLEIQDIKGSYFSSAVKHKMPLRTMIMGDH
jgi:hypothetical protein